VTTSGGVVGDVFCSSLRSRPFVRYLGRSRRIAREIDEKLGFETGRSIFERFYHPERENVRGGGGGGRPERESLRTFRAARTRAGNPRSKTRLNQTTVDTREHIFRRWRPKTHISFQKPGATTVVRTQRDFGRFRSGWAAANVTPLGGGYVSIAWDSQGANGAPATSIFTLIDGYERLSGTQLCGCMPGRVNHSIVYSSAPFRLRSLCWPSPSALVEESCQRD